jgi:hypothetical protein
MTLKRSHYLVTLDTLVAYIKMMTLQRNHCLDLLDTLVAYTKMTSKMRNHYLGLQDTLVVSAIIRLSRVPFDMNAKPQLNALISG